MFIGLFEKGRQWPQEKTMHRNGSNHSRFAPKIGTKEIKNEFKITPEIDIKISRFGSTETIFLLLEKTYP